MTGYITQEKYTAGAYLESGNRNLSFLGDVPSTLTSVLKCIFFDSRVEFQAHRDHNMRVAKLKTWVSTALDERATETASMDIDNVNLSSKEMVELIDERAQIKIEKIMKQFDNNIKTNGQYDEVTKIIKKQTAGECKLSIYSNKQQ